MAKKRSTPQRQRVPRIGPRAVAGPNQRDVSIDEELIKQHIKERLKATREAHALTLAQLSELIRTGRSKRRISPAHINRIENGKTIPSVVELHLINQALGSPLGPIFDFNAEEPWYIVRGAMASRRLDEVKADPSKITRTDNAHALMFQTGVYRYVPLDQEPQYVDPSDQSGILTPHIRALLFEVGDRATNALMNSPGALDSHEGEELIFVLEGEVEFWFQPDRQGPHTHQVLNQGDCLHFSSRLNHGFRATGGKPARALFVYTRPPSAAVPQPVRDSTTSHKGEQ